MKPKHIKELRRKEVRRIEKRQHEIWDERRKLGYRKLDEPIRHGWYKEIVITEQVERYRHQKEILEVFEMIENYYWGRTKAEADKVWFNQVSQYLIYRDLPTISKKQFNRLSDKAQKLCTPYRYRNSCNKLRTRFYVRIPRNAYRIKYTKAYITHSKIIDPLLESEYALLEQKLERHGYFNISTNAYWKHQWNNEILAILRKKDKLKTKQKLKALRLRY